VLAELVVMQAAQQMRIVDEMPLAARAHFIKVVAVIAGRCGSELAVPPRP